MDIIGQGGSDGLLVRPMVSEVVVNANPYEDGAECWVVELSSVEDPEDIVAYAHVTGEDSDGVHILAGRTFCWNDYFTQIGDFAGDGDTSNDHLHFGRLAPRRRNPLWDSPDYPRLAPGDGGPPTIEGVAFARYGGSYDLWNTLYSVADVAGGDIAHALEGEDVDIIVYAHDDDNRVGVRALYYKDSDPWEDEPIGDEWIPFCDFIGEVVDCASGYSARTSISFQIEQMMITLVPDFQSWFCH